MTKILIIEDDLELANMFQSVLEHADYDVKTVGNGVLALDYLDKEYVDLIITDIMMPEMDGYEFAESMRQVGDEVPILVISAKDDYEDKKLGFRIGVDDYMVKPFRAKELLSRINKIIRKNKDNNLIKVKNIVIDTDAARVYVDNVEVIFTSLEYRILLLLFQNLNRIVTREIIMEQIWDISGNFVEDNTLTVYIKRIREKLGSDIIKTIKGLGYRVDV